MQAAGESLQAFFPADWRVDAGVLRSAAQNIVIDRVQR